MNRINNDLRDWLDTDADRLPKGELGVDTWIKNEATVARVRELYPPSADWTQLLRPSGHALEPKNAPRSAAMSG
jgi:hypothetical protein